MAKKETALATWDAELAAAADEYAKQEANSGGGSFFSIRGGTLQLNGAPLPNNEMAAVIVDSVLENVHYEGDFDPDSPQAPSCYAFGRDEKTMKPHEEAAEPQCDEGCAECEHNKWGSAEKGRGKACRNRRRLAIIAAGTLTNGRFSAFDEPGEIESAPVAFLAVPPTSVNSFAAYVKQIAGGLRRPPHGVITRIKVVPDSKTQLKITFEAMGPVADELIPAVLKKHKEVKAMIFFPYAKPEEPAPKKAGKKKPRKF